MERLKKYCLELSCINGIDTYIISNENFLDLTKDVELMNEMQIDRSYIEKFIKIVEEVECRKLFLAFTYHKKWVKKLQWIPLLCYKHDNNYYHVHYTTQWVCMNCGYVHYGSFIMPMIEEDPIYYSCCDIKYPSISPIFKNIACINCGKYLTKHFILIYK